MNKNGILKIITNPIFITLLLLSINLIISIFSPMNNDEGMWCYIGRVWSQHGIPPYSGTVENKTPGIFELYALSNILFGINVYVVRLLGLLAVLISAFTVYLIGKKIHSALAGVFSMYLFGLISTWGMANGIFISHTEVFMVLFSTLSFYFIIKAGNTTSRKYNIFMAGIFMGFAIAFKQIAITTAFGLFLFYLYTFSTDRKQHKLTGVLLLGVGCLISTCVSILPLLLSSVTIKEYMEGAWLILLNSGSSSSLSSHLTGFINVFVFSRFAFFYPLFLILFLKRDLLKNRYFAGLFIWILFDFIGVNSSGYYYGHQFRQLIPSFSIIIGILLTAFITGLLNQNKNKNAYLILILSAIFVVMLPFKSLSLGIGPLLGNKQNNPDKELGIWINENTKKNDYVYLIDISSLPALAYSDRISSSKYFNSIFITSDVERNVVLNDLISRPPAIILKQNSSLSSTIHLGPKIEKWISQNYTFQLRKYGYDILKKK